MSDDEDKVKPERAFDAYAVRNDKEGKGYFHKIGAAFPHKDGEGYDIDMVAAPTNGRLTLRTPKERVEAKRSGNEREDSEHWTYKGKGGQGHER